MSKLCFTVEENSSSRYGLKVCFENGELYRYFASVTDRRDILESFAATCESEQISPLHIDDVMCDFISSLSFI